MGPGPSKALLPLLLHLLLKFTFTVTQNPRSDRRDKEESQIDHSWVAHLLTGKICTLETIPLEEGSG